jgi:2-octaprenyl-6-methoxyphenol hydroxylase
LDRSLINTDALGYVVPSRALGHALHRRLQNSTSIHYDAPAEVSSLQNHSGFVKVQIDKASCDRKTRLAVLADGGRSSLSQQIGIHRLEKSYPEQVVVAMVATDRDHNHQAYERFTRHGPLALLPAGPRRFALAWTLPETTAKAYADLTNRDFLSRLQASFGERAGVFCNIGKRKTYTVGLTELNQPISGRVVAVGNAAHIVHPVAGQGFNLGLRDVAELAEHLFTAIKDNQDFGSTAVLSRYADHRRTQTRRVLYFTDGLLRIFSNDYPLLNQLRGAGLQILDMIPGLKQHLLSRTVGLRGPLPRLARGLSLGTINPSRCQHK